MGEDVSTSIMISIHLPQSGNVGLVRETGEPVVFDPSSYFGHNEAE